MSAQLVKQEGHHIILQVTVDIGGMLEAEDRIQQAVNEVGCLATEQTLQQFDTDGSAIMMGNIKWTKRMSSPKQYQTPYGSIEVKRHVYQTSQGGKIYCPLEQNARIIRHATPRFAKQLCTSMLS